MEPSGSGSGMSDSMKTFLKKEKKLPPSLCDSTARKPLSASKGAVFGGKLIHSSSAPDFAVNHTNIQHRYDRGSTRKLPKMKKEPKVRAFPGQMRESPLKPWVTIEPKPVKSVYLFWTKFFKMFPISSIFYKIF